MIKYLPLVAGASIRPVSFIKYTFLGCYLALNYSKVLGKMGTSLLSCLGLSLTNIKISYFSLAMYLLLVENRGQVTMSTRRRKSNE